MILFDYKKNCGLNSKRIEKTAGELSSYKNELKMISKKRDYLSAESSIRLPADLYIVKHVKALAKRFDGRSLKYIMLVGIGGSNLGAKAVYEALYSKFDWLDEKRMPKIIFLDTVSSEKMKLAFTLSKSIKRPDELLIIATSKSGTTVETVANLEVIVNHFQRKFKNIRERIVFITDQDSALWDMAIKKDIHKLPIPAAAGGRYSVFSAAGLFPLHLAGINIDELRQGARQAVKDCTSGLFANPALVSAALTYLQYKRGCVIFNNFFFNPEYESIGKWQRQLMAESLGKKKNLKGKVVRAGITPMVSVGSTDLHSMAQLYFGGPKNIFTNFIYSKSRGEIYLPKNLKFAGLAEGINGKSLESLMTAIYSGVKTAYQKNKMPFAAVELAATEKNIGYYLQFRMIEMMYLAKLMDVNAFDQPGVEDYKREITELLNK
ncbi:MAG: hypothetical protein ACOZBH_03180 [Patescibacteria group bacterium]